MAVFGVIKSDDCVSLNDRFRIDATFSWITSNEPEITSLQIEPDAGFGFIDVTPDRYLDWAYDTAGTKTISLRIENGTGSFVFERTILVKTEDEDCCLANDSCLLVYENDVMKYLSCERTSFKYVHRKVAECIIDCLNRSGINDRVGCGVNSISCDQLKNNTSIERWATLYALDLIFSSLSSKVDDFFNDKSKLYRSMALDIQQSPNLYIDLNNDGQIDSGESINWCKRLELK